jgi:DNA-binding transcriptional regulator YdaS (Cro superfamily)
MNTAAAVNYFGSKAEIARVLGIGKTAVTNWGETIPIGRAYQIEVITNGALKAPRPEKTPDSAA